MNKKALIMTWDGHSDQELQYAYYRLKEDEFQVDIMSNSIGETIGVNGLKLKSDYNYTSLEMHYLGFLKSYDLLILPGGVKAMEKLRQETSAIDFVSDWFNQGKIIGSICHGSQLLISAKVCPGLNISGYYSIKDDIENAGAKYIDQPAVVSKNIVSTAHYKNLGPWMKAVLQKYYENK